MLLLLLPLVFTLGCSAQTRVTIPDLGTLEGDTEVTHFTNRTFYKFRGIRYAETPVRFMRPVKKQPWRDVMRTSEYGEMCLQLSNGNVNGSEDCLFLDVYTPVISNQSRLPVLFYIHGGSFIEGTTRNVKPYFLLEHDLILVAAQYRLGPLGFLTLNSTNKTGNAGLYDVVLALNWVHDNIQHFGGDPNKITVAGNSAGAGMAGLLYVSPLTQDLIQQVMLFSGSALSPWTLDSNPITSSRLIAREVGCNNNTDGEMLICLQEFSNPINLTIAYNNLQARAIEEGLNDMGGVTPIIDNEILVELPEETMKKNTFKGRPMFMSVTKSEGIFLADSFTKSGAFSSAAANMERQVVDSLLNFAGIKDPAYIVAPSIVDTYFMPGDPSSIQDGVVDFLGSVYFKGPGLRMAQLNTMRNGTSFITSFSYDPEGKGVDHMVEQHYLFLRNVTGFTDEDYDIARKFTSLCANFIIKGSPAEDGLVWDPYSRSDEVYLVFDKNEEFRRGFEQEFTITKKERLAKENSAVGIYPGHFLMILVATFVLARYN